MRAEYDIAIVGGGIVGLATAMALSERPDLSLVVLEAEHRLAAHQTGHNSGVVHSGLYYRPRSLKAITCVEGSRLLYDFCERTGIPYQRCGKLVIATRPEELPALETLERNGRENGLLGLRRLTAEEIAEYEPHATGIAALWVAETGIVDFVRVALEIARIARDNDAQIFVDARVLQVTLRSSRVIVQTTAGDTACKMLVNCGGLFADRIARLCGLQAEVSIIPFRGEYYRLTRERSYLVKNLIYPVPDPRFPFLGVHFTRKLDGTVEAGPNAVLAFSRTGYSRRDFSLKDLGEMLSYSGFWRLAAKYWRTGLYEMWRSFNKQAFTRSLQRLVPEVTADDLVPGGSGVRAQAVSRDGRLLDDFVIQRGESSIHILNAPSPAATASIAIGRRIAAIVRDSLK
jgi:L-2-hydroxyglutarate oxidase